MNRLIFTADCFVAIQWRVQKFNLPLSVRQLNGSSPYVSDGISLYIKSNSLFLNQRVNGNKNITKVSNHVPGLEESHLAFKSKMSELPNVVAFGVETVSRQ